MQREFEENPLLRNLGVTIYGSLYDWHHKEQERYNVHISLVAMHSLAALFLHLVCVCSVRPLAHHGSIGNRLTVDTDFHTGLSSGTEAVSGAEDLAAAVGE